MYKYILFIIMEMRFILFLSTYKVTLEIKICVEKRKQSVFFKS